MITVTDKSRCTGCTACLSACPADCIAMRRDEEGFVYPVADPMACIDCGKCVSVCPVLNPRKESEPLKAYALRVPEYVDGSSSGGVFPYLAADVVKDGGVVFGSVIREDMTVAHVPVDTTEGIGMLRGSKYVQSDMGGVLEDVKTCLDAGRRVLFSGTPCQIAGLKSFLGKEYDTLLSVEVACHGVPGPGLWEKYIEALENRYGAKIRKVTFRDKSRSWMHYDFTVVTETSRFSVPYTKDPYMSLFVQDLTLRPSCYSCPARNGRSGSDLCLADLWTVADLSKEMNDDKGASLALVYTDKGAEALKGLSARAVDYRTASGNNGGFAASVDVPKRRAEFFRGLGYTNDLLAFMKGFVVRKPWYMTLYRSTRSFLSGLKRRMLK